MLKIATWNLQWATPRSSHTSVITRRLDAASTDIAVLTEVDLRTLSTWEHVFDAGQHPLVRGPDKRKVAIVSRLPMKLVDAVGSAALPPNNFVAVDVEAPFGNVRVIGIVIRYNQKAEYVDALPEALEETVTAHTIVAGDFNLTIPGGP